MTRHVRSNPPTDRTEMLSIPCSRGGEGGAVVKQMSDR